MDRTIQPEIQALKKFHILPPVRTTLPNGIPLAIVNAGEQEVVRIDILFAGGRWQQSQKLQALFTNRMLREGTRKYTAAIIAEKLDYYGSWLELSSSSEYAYITVYSLNKYLAKTLEVVESNPCVRRTNCIPFWIRISSNTWSILLKSISWHIVVCCRLFTEHSTRVDKSLWKKTTMPLRRRFSVVSTTGIIIRAIVLFSCQAR